MSDLTGELIDGRYQLQKLVAAGGMASIYSALDLRLDRMVAVKIMHPHLANDEEYVTRFIREAKAAASLSHPNVVAIQDQGWNEGGAPAVFLVMEFVDGFTLRELIHEKGSLGVKEALRYISPVISALVAAHKLGIVHRDIKPENILIAKDGRVKVADFGLARGGQSSATMTIESSVILGSVSYLSPEQVQRGVSDARSDVYALGIVLFEMLTGTRPFAGDSPIQIAYKHVNERVPAPSSLKAGIPSLLDAIVVRATDPNPDKRYASAVELESEIQRLQRDLDPSNRQLSLELDVPPLIKEERTKSRAQKLRGAVGIGAPVISTTISELTSAREKDEVATSKKSSTAEIKRKRKLSKRVKRNRFIALLLVVALTYGAFRFFFSGAKVAIPSLVGLTQSQANSTLATLGLKSDVAGTQFSEETKKGLILATEPGGGGSVRVHGTVHLTISGGPERISVPDVSGLSVDAATAALKAAGLQVGTTSQEYSDTIPKDMVATTSPAAASPAKRGAMINIITSLGQALGGTSYVGLSADQALNEITNAGFTVNTIYGYSDTVAIGMVISQSAPTAPTANKKSVITLIVSQGPAYAYVPQVTGMSEAKARSAIQNLGLLVKKRVIGTRRNKVVISISPKAKSKVKPGATVTITLG